MSSIKRGLKRVRTKRIIRSKVRRMAQLIVAENKQRMINSDPVEITDYVQYMLKNPV